MVHVRTKARPGCPVPRFGSLSEQWNLGGSVLHTLGHFEGVLAFASLPALCSLSTQGTSSKAAPHHCLQGSFSAASLPSSFELPLTTLAFSSFLWCRLFMADLCIQCHPHTVVKTVGFFPLCYKLHYSSLPSFPSFFSLLSFLFNEVLRGCSGQS